MTNNFDFIVAGNYLTSLIAALELSKKGKKVCLVNPLPGWGGHFTKININGLAFDPGSVAHEFTAFNEHENLTDPLEYTPYMRNDWGRFTRLIENYTRSHIELAEMETPSTVYDGQLYPDIIMINRLEVLQHPFIKGRIKEEAAFILSQPPSELHPRNKKNSAAFIDKSYYEASVANHGATMHSELFEPYMHKMSALSTTNLIARFHRIAWLPLYYPETIAAQYEATPQVLHKTVYCYPKAGYVGHFAEVLVQKLTAAGVTIVREPVEKLIDGKDLATLQLKNGETISGRKVIWSLAHDQIISQVTGKAPNQFERWSAGLVFFTINRKDLLRSFSVLYSPDKNGLFYRASNQSMGAGLDEEQLRIVVEFNPDFAAGFGLTNEQDIVQRICTDLCKLGLANDPAHWKVEGVKTLRNVLLIPSKHNWRLLEQERDVLYEHYPNVFFTRNTEAFFTDTLNDQIIKGLRVAALFESF